MAIGWLSREGKIYHSLKGMNG
ncbi:MAG: hypothetical protein HC905_23375 [Bacteroidales bacterium]|nr:hypothetical protein [Bacteroidales bacterium]